MFLIIVVWLLTTPTNGFWPAWPIAGMAIGAFFMGLDAYGPKQAPITEQDVDEEMARLAQRKSGS